MLSILQAIWQADGNFPSGSFAFSYGVEGAIAMHDRFDVEALRALAMSILRQRWATLDQIALVKAFRGWDDIDEITRVDQLVEAATFGETFRDGSRRNGGAFLAAHARIGTPAALRLREEVRAARTPGHMAVMQGSIWRSLGIDEQHARIASGYLAMSGAMTAMVRLNAVGVLDSQRVLREMLPLIETLSSQPVDDDLQLSGFLPFLDIAATRHSRASLRLFSN